MILDSQEAFSELQSLVSATGDVVSTNIFDTGAPADVGIGEPIWLYAKVGTAVVGASSTTQLVLQTATDAAFTTPVEFPLTSAKAPAALTANAEIYKGRLPIGLLRYVRVVYRIAGAAVTAGTASAYLVKDVQANVAYPSGFTVA